jgi:hypothetical protein
MPLRLFDQRTILVKVEVTYGTDVVPAVGTDAMLTFEGSVAFEADKLERKQDRAFFGGDPFVLVGKRAIVEFDFEMLGHATPGTAAPIGPVLRACGHGQTLSPGVSATYAPVSSGFASATIYFWHADRLFEIVGARGTIDWSIGVKGYPKGRAKFVGLIDTSTPTQSSPGAVTLTAFQVPPVVETETLLVTVGGTTLNAIGVEFSQNADIKIFEGSELREVTQVERMPNGVLRVFDDLASLSTFNPWNIANASTDQAIEVTVSGTAGKIVRLQVPVAQLEYPRVENVDGVIVWAIPFNAKPSGAGNDEYNWRFT